MICYASVWPRPSSRRNTGRTTSCRPSTRVGPLVTDTHALAELLDTEDIERACRPDRDPGRCERPGRGDHDVRGAARGSAGLAAGAIVRHCPSGTSVGLHHRLHPRGRPPAPGNGPCPSMPPCRWFDPGWSVRARGSRNPDLRTSSFLTSCCEGRLRRVWLPMLISRPSRWNTVWNCAAATTTSPAGRIWGFAGETRCSDRPRSVQVAGIGTTFAGDPDRCALPLNIGHALGPALVRKV